MCFVWSYAHKFLQETTRQIGGAYAQLYSVMLGNGGILYSAGTQAQKLNIEEAVKIDVEMDCATRKLTWRWASGEHTETV